MTITTIAVGRRPPTSQTYDRLRSTLRADGCVLVRDLIDEDALARVQDELAARMPQPTDWATLRGSDLGGPLHEIRCALLATKSAVEVFRDPVLLELMGGLLETPTPYLHPRRWLRVSPHSGNVHRPVGLHQDYPFVQGTADVLTTWVPLHRCTDEGIVVFPGSHRRGVLPPESLRSLATDRSPVTIAVSPGDVVIMHSLLVHGAAPNASGLNRISMDGRYQRPDEPLMAEQLRPGGVRQGLRAIALSEDPDPRVWSGDPSCQPPAGLPIIADEDPLPPMRSRFVPDVVSGAAHAD
ncbi:MAG: hypothetical protein QOH84_2340 [Kribbellaceae bacterium]|jgi:hypothetical protein|nr:hypothetical protein [Kribbellaceae bacterium]